MNHTVRLVSVFSIGLYNLLCCDRLSQSAPIPVVPQPDGVLADGLRLTIEATSRLTQYKQGRDVSQVILTVRLDCNDKLDRKLEKMPTFDNRLDATFAVKYIIRSETTVEATGAALSDFHVPSLGKPDALPVPLILKPGKPALARHELASEIMRNPTGTSDWYAKAKPFCVTAVIPALKLKSNTIYFNGFKRVDKDYDPFKDLEEATALQMKRLGR